MNIRLVSIVLFVIITFVMTGCSASSRQSGTSQNLEAQLVDTEEVETTIVVGEADGEHYLSAPYYYQKDVPTYGSVACGPTSLKMVLEYSSDDVPAISEMIQIIGVSSDLQSGANVDNYFISGFGITDVAMKKLAQELGYSETIIFGESYYPDYPRVSNDFDGEGWRAQIDEDGWDTEKLHEVVIAGSPVIVDVTVGMDPLGGKADPISYAPFYSGDGDEHWELRSGGGHYVVVIGFQNWDTDNAKIIVLDPLDPGGEPDNIRTYPLEIFEKSWELLNNQGLLIK